MENKGKILIVDDNQEILLSLNMLLRPWVDSIRAISDPERIMEFVEHFQPDVILLDMNFRRDVVSGEEGYHWLSRIMERDPLSVVILMTAYVSTEKTVRAIKAGAVDFIPKPWENRKMLDTVLSAVELRRSRVAEKQAAEKEPEQPKSDNRNIIGESDGMQLLKERIRRVAATVSCLGQRSGTQYYR
jgi:DNA-binding NtrC family response regulator